MKILTRLSTMNWICSLVLIGIVATGSLTSCQTKKALTEKKVDINNTLTNAEIADGWELMFNGINSEGWRAFNKDYFPSGWVVDNGTIRCNASGNAGGSTEGGDIMFNRKYANFHLSLDWKISKGGNSGIFYLGTEAFDYIWKTAPEMQILDNANYPGGDLGEGNKRKAGALYDLISAVPQNSNPFGQWNNIEIIVKNRAVTYKMNGVQVVSFELDTPEWHEMVKNSKFPELNPDWANVPQSGYIGLQDHGDDVWFRNIKIKKL